MPSNDHISLYCWDPWYTSERVETEASHGEALAAAANVFVSIVRLAELAPLLTLATDDYLLS